MQEEKKKGVSYIQVGMLFFVYAFKSIFLSTKLNTKILFQKL